MSGVDIFLIDDSIGKVLSVPSCPYHFVRTIVSNAILSVYHFVHTILSIPFCPLPFCPRTPLTPCTVSGNRFILTGIDFASHFPLAFPIKTHTAAEVVRCLIYVFTTFGFPDQILSDCGSDFMSELIQLFCVSVRWRSSKRRRTILKATDVWNGSTGR